VITPAAVAATTVLVASIPFAAMVRIVVTRATAVVAARIVAGIIVTIVVMTAATGTHDQSEISIAHLKFPGGIGGEDGLLLLCKGLTIGLIFPCANNIKFHLSVSFLFASYFSILY
jgi:hypothetical protein